jgi:multisubunit Na+/H+ antiporter MnhC subunit
VFVAALVVGALVIVAALVALVVAAVRVYRRLDEAGDPLSKDPEDLR